MKSKEESNENAIYEFIIKNFIVTFLLSVWVLPLKTYCWL